MVDVGAKPDDRRRARARAVVRMSPETAATVARGDAPKGDVLGTARIAGIQAAKRTAELIPLAHPLPLTFVDVEAAIDSRAGTVTLESEARTTGPTGVEMEALTACAVAALTVYDMVKGIERGVTIEQVDAAREDRAASDDWTRDRVTFAREAMRAAIITISTLQERGRGSDESGPALARVRARARRRDRRRPRSCRTTASRSSGRFATTATRSAATWC